MTSPHLTSTEDAPISDAPPPAPRRTGTWVTVLVTLIGALIALGIVSQAVVMGFMGTAQADDSTYTSPVDGVTALDIDVSAGELTVRFADVPEATLEVHESGWRIDRTWVLEVSEEVLHVSDSSDSWFWPFLGNARTTAELVLPAELEGSVDARLELSAGDLTVTGDMQDVDIDVSAGTARFDGASTAMAVNVSAGDAHVVTDGPDTVYTEVSAGSVVATVTGPPPSQTTVDVSAGDATIELPDGGYAVTGDASAGDRTVEVRTDPSSPNGLHVEVSAGSATIRYSD